MMSAFYVKYWVGVVDAEVDFHSLPFLSPFYNEEIIKTGGTLKGCIDTGYNRPQTGQGESRVYS